MAKQIIIYYNAEDRTRLFHYFDEIGGVVVTSDGEHVFPPDLDSGEVPQEPLNASGKNVYIISRNHFNREKIGSVKVAEAIEFMPCRPQPQTIPDRSELYARLNAEFPGCIYKGCILVNTPDMDRRFHELMKEVSMIPNPDYINGTEAGRLYFEPYFQSEEGKLRKSEEICNIYSKVQRFIKRYYAVSANNFAYIAPQAYSDYKSGSFIPCQGKNKISFM